MRKKQNDRGNYIVWIFFFSQKPKENKDNFPRKNSYANALK